MRGTKPTPRNLRIVRGDDRPSRMNKDEPIVPVVTPDPPEHLSVDEQDKFREMAHKLARMRVMTEADVDALAIYAVNYCRWIDATQRVRETGPLIASRKTGVMYQNPYLGVANKAEAQMKSILAEFGMTPSSRTRVKSH